MPYVRFLRDYQGKVTNEVFYAAGTVVRTIAKLG